MKNKGRKRLMMKNIISLIMALITLMSISTVAFAAESHPTYELDKKNGILTVYSDDGYEDLYNDYIAENSLDKEPTDEMEVFYEIMSGLKTVHFGKDARCYFLSEMFDTVESIEVDKDNPYMCVFDKALYTKDKKTLLAYPYASDDVDVYIPSECEDFSGGYTFSYIKHKKYDEGWTVWFRPIDKKYNFYFEDPTGEQVDNMIFGEWGMLYPTDGIYVAKDTYKKKLEVLYTLAKMNVFYMAAAYLPYIEETETMDEIVEALDNKQIELCLKEKELIEEYCDNHEEFDDIDFYYENSKFYEEFSQDMVDCAEKCGLIDVLEKYDDFYQTYLEIINQKTDVIKVYDPSIKISTESDKINVGETITFKSEVKMPEGEITWYVDGEKVCIGETFTAENLTVGEHTVKSVIAFPNGETSESNEISVTVAKQTFIQRVAEFFRNISTFLTSIFAKIVGIFG